MGEQLPKLEMGMGYSSVEEMPPKDRRWFEVHRVCSECGRQMQPYARLSDGSYLCQGCLWRYRSLAGYAGGA